MPTQSDFIWKEVRRWVPGLSKGWLSPFQGWLAPSLQGALPTIHKCELRLLTILLFYEYAFKIAKMLSNHCAVTEWHLGEEIYSWFFSSLYRRRLRSKMEKQYAHRRQRAEILGNRGFWFPEVPSSSQLGESGGGEGVTTWKWLSLTKKKACVFKKKKK